MRIQYIGIAGRAGSGKSTVASLIARDYKNSLIMALADPIKDMTSALLDSIGAYGPHEKEQPVESLGASPRRIMQTLGTEWGRTCIGDDFWLRVFEARVDRAVQVMKDNGDTPDLLRIIVPDVRFPNEAAWFNAPAKFNRGLIALTNGSRRGGEGALGPQESMHASEQAFAEVREQAHVAIANEPDMGLPELATAASMAARVLEVRRNFGETYDPNAISAEAAEALKSSLITIS